MMNNIPKDYEFTLALEPVTPICIASGRRFAPVDYVAAPKAFTVKNIRKWLASGKASIEEKERVISGGKSQSIPDEFNAYTLRNLAGAAQFGNNPVLEFMRDAEGRAYIPGSSIKGIVRSAVLFAALKNKTNGDLLASELNRISERAAQQKRPSPQWASQPLQQKVLSGTDGGTAPNRDAMKSLIIRDSPPIPDDRLALCKAVVWRYDASMGAWEPKKTGNAVMAAFVEAFVPDSATRYRIPIQFVFKGYFWQRDVEEAGLPEPLKIVLSDERKLREVLFEFSQSVLKAERKFYEKVGATDAEKFCDTCFKANAIFLPVGFSTGWMTKTVGPLLDEDRRRELVRIFNLDRGRNSDPFPKTRKLVRMPDGRELPMGWARLSLVRTPAQDQGGATNIAANKKN